MIRQTFCPFSLDKHTLILLMHMNLTLNVVNRLHAIDLQLLKLAIARACDIKPAVAN